MAEDSVSAPAPSSEAGQAESTPKGQADSTQTLPTGQAPATDSANDSSTSSESFTKLDPATLPPELKGHYDSMLTDYRAKTADISQARSKADAFDALMGNETFSSLVNSMANQQTKTQDAAPTDLASLSGPELLSQLIENPGLLNQMIEQKAQGIMAPMAESYYQDKAEAEIGRLRSAYPDFQTKEEEIAKLVETKGYDPEDAYKMLTWGQKYQDGINKGVQAAKDRSGAAQPDSGTAKVSPTRVKNIFEAFDLAKQAHNWNS